MHAVEAPVPEVGPQGAAEEAGAADHHRVVQQQVDAERRRPLATAVQLVVICVALLALVPPEVMVARNVDGRDASKR